MTHKSDSILIFCESYSMTHSVYRINHKNISIDLSKIVSLSQWTVTPLLVAALDLQSLQKTVRVLPGHPYAYLAVLCESKHLRSDVVPKNYNKIKLNHNLGVERQLTHGDKLPQFYQG